MSVVARVLSSGVARGLAALLALLLSAVIGSRLSVDRLTLELVDEESSPVSCPLADLATDPSAVPATMVQYHDTVRPLLAARTLPVRTAHHLAAPTLLIGSAGGPRAP